MSRALGKSPLRCWVAVSAAIGAWLSCLPPAQAVPYVLPDAELLNAEFTKEWGTSTLNAKVDVPGPGVQFTLTFPGSGDGKTGIGDNWPVTSAAGLDWDPGLGHWSSLAAYGSYQMTIQYVSGAAGSDINVHLFMNTGLTGPSAYPSNDPTNDTFWGGPWVTLALGEMRTLTLDFAGAEAWNVSDNKAPHTGGGLGWADGGIYAINDRDCHEVSNIGLEIADFDGDALGNQVTMHFNAVPEPVTMLVLVIGSLRICMRKRTRT